MAETVLEGNHKISPDLRTIVTAGLASHLTLISRRLKRLLLGVKSASFLNNVKWKKDYPPPTHTHTETSRFAFSSFYLPLTVSYLCCIAALCLLPELVPSCTHWVPQHLFLSAHCMTGSFCRRRHFGYCLLCSTRRTGPGTRPAFLTDLHRSEPLSFPNIDATVSIINLIRPPSASRTLVIDTLENLSK